MSLERRTTCAAYPSQCSTVVTSILPIERQTEYRHVVSTCCTWSSQFY